jgi:hypothetical protein
MESISTRPSGASMFASANTSRRREPAGSKRATRQWSAALALEAAADGGASNTPQISNRRARGAVAKKTRTLAGTITNGLQSQR